MSDSTANNLAPSKPSSGGVALKPENGGWLSKLPTPLITAILTGIVTVLAGIVTVAGTVVSNFVQGYGAVQLQREKQQHELILKMISVGDLKQAKENVHFLAESGLITDPEQAKKILASKANPVLPQPSGLPGLPNGTPCGPNDQGTMRNGMCIL